MDKLKPCLVGDCENSRKYNDKYCSKHRARLSRTGRLTRKSTSERLNEKSEINDKTGCIEWQGYLNEWGYGRIRVKGKKMLAHRQAWIEESGEIPEGFMVCHKCDNPSCINVGHLFLGTAQENHQDAVEKGRIDPVERAKRRWKLCPTIYKS